MPGLLVSIAAAATCATFTAPILSSILPRVIRDTSSRSSTRRTSCFNWRAISSRAHASFPGSSSLMRRMCTALLIGASGIAQLVREHREELVLALVLLLDLAKQQRIVERGRRAGRELRHHRERIRIEAARRRFEPERQHAELAATNQQRHEHQRMRGKAARQRNTRSRRVQQDPAR